MINTVTLIGRIANDIEVKELEKSKVANISLAVSRTYKNTEGNYETDFIDCVLWNEIAERVKGFCNKGDLIAITGRLQTTVYEVEDKKRKSVDVIVEKVTFLQPKKTEE